MSGYWTGDFETAYRGMRDNGLNELGQRPEGWSPDDDAERRLAQMEEAMYELDDDAAVDLFASETGFAGVDEALASDDLPELPARIADAQTRRLHMLCTRLDNLRREWKRVPRNRARCEREARWVHAALALALDDVFTSELVGVAD